MSQLTQSIVDCLNLGLHTVVIAFLALSGLLIIIQEKEEKTQ